MNDVIEVEATESFRSRLRTLMNDCGGIKAFSEKTGIPYQTARQYLVKSDPTRSVLLKVSERLEVSPNWLLLGQGSKSSIVDAVIAEKESEYFRHELNRRIKNDEELGKLERNSQINSVRLMQLRQSGEPTLSEAIRICRALNIDSFPNPVRTDLDDFLILPELDFYKYNQSLMLDFDFREQDKIIHREGANVLKPGPVGFRRSELDSDTPENAESLVCYRMHDSSMHPDMPIGSFIMIDLSDNIIDHQKTFLFRFGGKPHVHTALRRGGDNWRLKQTANDETIDCTSSELARLGALIGRVVGRAEMPQ